MGVLQQRFRKRISFWEFLFQWGVASPHQNQDSKKKSISRITRLYALI